MNPDPLILADACRRDEPDVRPECRAAGDPHRASGAAAIPSRQPRRALEAPRKPCVDPEHRHPEGKRFRARCAGELVDEAFAEEAELALRRAPHVPAGERERSTDRLDPNVGYAVGRHRTFEGRPAKLCGSPLPAQPGKRGAKSVGGRNARNGAP